MNEVIESRRSLQRVIDSLIMRAIMDAVVSTNPREPGYYIKQLSFEDRELLSEAKGCNFNGRMSI